MKPICCSWTVADKKKNISFKGIQSLNTFMKENYTIPCCVVSWNSLSLSIHHTSSVSTFVTSMFFKDVGWKVPLGQWTSMNLSSIFVLLFPFFLKPFSLLLPFLPLYWEHCLFVRRGKRPEFFHTPAIPRNCRGGTGSTGCHKWYNQMLPQCHTNQKIPKKQMKLPNQKPTIA